MSRSTFNYLCDKVRPFLQKQDTPLRAAIPVEDKVAVTLWRLTSNADYQRQSYLAWDIPQCVVLLGMLCCCKKLLPHFVNIPTGAKLREIVDGFESRWGFPETVGAIDGTHSND